MIKCKMCPRCRGDMYLTEDIFGKHLSCLQCGYLRDLKVQRLEVLPGFDTRVHRIHRIQRKHEAA